MGKLVFFAAGIIMFVFELYWFARWWGGGGVAVALFVPPLAAAFPFIYLVKEGFSLLYFGVWGVGVLGAVLANDS